MDAEGGGLSERDVYDADALEELYAALKAETGVTVADDQGPGHRRSIRAHRPDQGDNSGFQVALLGVSHSVRSGKFPFSALMSEYPFIDPKCALTTFAALFRLGPGSSSARAGEKRQLPRSRVDKRGLGKARDRRRVAAPRSPVRFLGRAG